MDSCAHMPQIQPKKPLLSAENRFLPENGFHFPENHFLISVFRILSSTKNVQNLNFPPLFESANARLVRVESMADSIESGQTRLELEFFESSLDSTHLYELLNDGSSEPLLY